VLVEDERYLPAEVPLAPAQSALSIQMRRGARIVGTFFGKSGQPLAGAVVLTYSADREVRSVVDGQGAFELSGLEPGRWLLRTHVPGASNPWNVWRLVELERDQEVEVDLREDAAGPELRVTSETEERGARLSIAPGTPRDPTSYSELRSVALDLGEATGGTLKPVPPGTYTLFLWAYDDGFRIARQVIKVDSRPVQEVRARMKLPPPSDANE